MSDIISIQGLDKAEVLAALYHQATLWEGAIVVEPPFQHVAPEPLTVAAAREILDRSGGVVGAVNGKSLQVSLEGDLLDPARYDRSNGKGTAARAIAMVIRCKDSAAASSVCQGRPKLASGNATPAS